MILVIFFYFQIKSYLAFLKKTSIFDNSLKMANNKFYNSLDFPLISVILDFGKLKLNFLQLQNYILNLLNQTIKDIEIIVFIYKKEIFDINLIYNLSLIDKRIQTYISNNSSKIKNIFEMANQIKGKFVFFVYHLMKFNSNEFQHFFNITRAKIDNIFYIKSYNNHSLYLIRTKILKDIVDSANILLVIMNYINISVLYLIQKLIIFLLL